MEPTQTPNRTSEQVENRKMNQEIRKLNNYLIPISIIVAGLIVAGGIYLGGKHNETAQLASNNTNDPAQKEVTIKPVTKDDHILGSPNAKVVMVEYSDLECPFCKNFQSTLHQVMNKYGKNGDVAWVYRHFPLTELHPKAPKEAEASECANELGGNDAFFKFIDAVYAITPSNNGLDPTQLPTIAGQIGLNVNDFNSCLNSGKYSDKVLGERSDAIAAGGQGTPYTILVTSKGNIPINQGAISYAQLSSLIEQVLASK